MSTVHIPPSTPTSAARFATVDRKPSESEAVAEQFEKMFVGQFVDEMMKTVKQGSSQSKFGEDMWRSFLSEAIAEQLAGTGKFGLAGNIKEMLDAYRK